jgi:hypothetical protein
MRQLKFRIWDKTEKQFTNISPSFVCDSQEKVFEFCGSLHQRKNWVIQQFTGVKDKKGNEIYEGDRVRYKLNKNYFYDEVKWEHNGWRVVNEKEDCSFPLITNLEDFEVVGNIFQLPCNPDHNGECLVCDCWLSDCAFNKKE